MNGIEHISCIRSGEIVMMIDLIYSPDDNGYYLEKSILPDNRPMILLVSDDMYPNDYAARLAYKFNSVTWIEQV